MRAPDDDYPPPGAEEPDPTEPKQTQKGLSDLEDGYIDETGARWDKKRSKWVKPGEPNPDKSGEYWNGKSYVPYGGNNPITNYDYSGYARKSGSGGDGFGSMGDLLEPFTDPFEAPPERWHYEDAPNFDAPDYVAPDPFSYADFEPGEKFQAPSAEEAMNDQGYKFRLAEGQRVLENAGSAKGVSRSGGMMKDLLNYGQNAASQEYQNVYSRRAGEYDRDFSNRLTSWGTNYKKAADTWATNTAEGLAAYDRLYQGALAEFAPKMTNWQTKTQTGQRQNELDYSRAWNEYLERYEIFKHNHEWPFEALSKTAAL